MWRMQQPVPAVCGTSAARNFSPITPKHIEASSVSFVFPKISAARPKRRLSGQEGALGVVWAA